MKKILSLAVLAVTLFSCQKQEAPAVNEPISQDVLAAIGKAGFSTEGVIREEGGYIVEGDIFIDDNHLRTQPQWNTHYIVETEQYHTTNLVNAGGGRVIKVSISNKLPSSYVDALDECIARYNAENLLITMQRVSSGADISIVSAGGNFLASAGFPSGGNPFNQIKVNSRAIGNQPQSTVATILAHEIGHCIGFRHTDYMDRSISCGGSTANEGASSVGAIWIQGTPQTAAQVEDAISKGDVSFMLSCISSRANRPFSTSDKTALSYLY
ncbi:MAG TPA: M57 family metalloprotease [Chitinophagaceae bacterium]|nr:M57 family metalloprotease [Chitinophagaceae bacterium]